MQDPDVFEDYYSLAKHLHKPGCCLFCKDAHPGCLCYDCKCMQCVHYSEPGHPELEECGSCDIATKAKKEAEEKKQHYAILREKEQQRRKEARFNRLGLSHEQTLLSEIDAGGEIDGKVFDKQEA